MEELTYEEALKMFQADEPELAEAIKITAAPIDGWSPYINHGRWFTRMWNVLTLRGRVIRDREHWAYVVLVGNGTGLLVRTDGWPYGKRDFFIPPFHWRWFGTRGDRILKIRRMLPP